MKLGQLTRHTEVIYIIIIILNSLAKERMEGDKERERRSRAHTPVGPASTYRIDTVRVRVQHFDPAKK